MPRERALRRIAVYCGSSDPPDPRYRALAADVGMALARAGIGIVYGGGRMGLMGALADAALGAGGEVIGVITRPLARIEFANPACTELYEVSTMHQRKAKFARLADGFLTLPGGTGTMEEMWEALSWAQIGYHTKPVALLNAFGFYAPLLAMIAQMAEVGFIRPVHAHLLLVEPTLAPLLARMQAYSPPPSLIAIAAEGAI